jgi:hypothetical protein
VKLDPEEQALFDDIVRVLDEYEFNTTEYTWILLEKLERCLSNSDTAGAMSIVQEMKRSYKGEHLLS